MQKQKEHRSESEDTMVGQQLEEDALHILETRNHRQYRSLKEIDLVEILRTFPAET